MKPKEHVPQLHYTAAVTLPGLKQAHAILDMSIRVIEYFDRHATRDAATGTFTLSEPPPESLQKEAQQLRSLLSAFEKRHAKPS